MKRKRSSKRTKKVPAGTRLPISTQRAIFIHGVLDENLAHVLTPQILRLKQEGNEPITMFIDSPGGRPVIAGRILGLLRAVDQSGERPNIITVATGEASSAAADLLTKGDYVMAYPHALLHFHGTHFTPEHPITRKRAERLEASLRWDDANASRELALGVFERFLQLHNRYAGAVASARESPEEWMSDYDDLIGEGIFDVPALIDVLSDKTDGDAPTLLMKALYEMSRIKEILERYKGLLKSNADSTMLSLIEARVKVPRRKTNMQLRVLESVIASNIIENVATDDPCLSFRELEADFDQVSTLAEGIFQDDLLDLLLKYEDMFFAKADSEKIAVMRATMTAEQLDGDKRARHIFDAAVGRAYRRAEPLWQYVTTLCRLLNEGENEIKPEDAWHMGLVDEVVGLPLAHRIRTPDETDAIMQSLAIADMQKFMQ